MAKNLTKLWRELIQSTNGKVFSVTFTKKNGERRTLIGRVGVKKYVTGEGLHYNAAARGLMPVFDFQKKDYRMVNLNTIESFRCGKIKI